MSAHNMQFYPEFQRNETETSSGSKVVSYASDLGNDSPILTLIHGYPQSAYEFRYVVPKLKDHVSLFIPELPGYGISTPCREQARKDIGGALVEALQKTFNLQQGSSRKVIVGGHDRGARMTHHIVVNKKSYPGINIAGAVMLDIIPTKVQWDKFSNPAICAGYFHWPLLANVDLSTRMIKAFGGGRWCREMHERISGSEEDLERIKGDGGLDVYASLFDKEDVLKYTAEDYSTGASPEYSAQDADQKNGRKIDVPALVMFSKAKLGARIDVAKEWEDWIATGVSLEAIGVGDGHGHFLPEEAPDAVSSHVLTHIKKCI